MPWSRPYAMTCWRSSAGIGRVGSELGLLSGPYQPASNSTYCRPRVAAKSTAASPSAVVRLERNALPGLIQDVSASRLGRARVVTRSPRSTRSAALPPTMRVRHGVANGVATENDDWIGPPPRCAEVARYDTTASASSGTEASSSRG
ncbi:hypothetical protein GCM10029978_082690 [Actinoallomurus acanthiterrae]